MTTAETIVARLPNTPTVTPIDIATACNLKSTNAILNAIQSGVLSAVKFGKSYVISRDNAVAFIRKAEVEASK